MQRSRLLGLGVCKLKSETTMSKRIFNLSLLFLLVACGGAQAGTVTYVYTDPQGTPLAEADASGNITARFDYTPYGVSVPSMGAAPSGLGYTGHVNDPETGLVYMQARYYDAEVGRFLSVDPVGVALGNTFNFNRFAYANNNPNSFIDPSGKEICGVYSCEISDSGWSSGSAGGSQAGGRYTIAFDGAGEHLVGRENTENGTLDTYIRSKGGTVYDGGLIFSGSRGRAKAAQVMDWLHRNPSGHANVYGYSRGGVAAVALVNELGKRDGKVNLLVLFDPVSSKPLSVTHNNVSTALNFFQRNPSNPMRPSGNPFNGRPVSGVQSRDLTGYNNGSVNHNNIIDVVTDPMGGFSHEINDNE